MCENAIYIVIEKKGALYPPAPYDLATGREGMEINLGYNPSELEQYAYIRPTAERPSVKSVPEFGSYDSKIFRSSLS